MTHSYHPYYPSYPQTPYQQGPHAYSAQPPSSSMVAAPMMPSAPSFAAVPSHSFSPSYPSPQIYQGSPHQFQQPFSSPIASPYPGGAPGHLAVNANFTGLPTELMSSPYANEYTSYAPMDTPGSSRRSDMPVGRRQRVTMACTYCRRRKIRCDGAAPCSNCARSARCCDYAPIPTSESTKASRARKIAQVLREGVTEPLSRMSSPLEERMRDDTDFACAPRPLGPSPFPHMEKTQPSVLLPASQTDARLGAAFAMSATSSRSYQALGPSRSSSGHTSSVLAPGRSNSLDSSASGDLPVRASSRAAPANRLSTGYTYQSTPLSPPYTPISVHDARSGPPSVLDISMTPDLITPMTGFNMPAPMEQQAYPSRPGVFKQTMSYHEVPRVQEFLPSATYLSTDRFTRMNVSAPSTPSKLGHRRTTSSIQGYAGGLLQTDVPISYAAPTMPGGGLVGLGIMMPTKEDDLYRGMSGQGRIPPPPPYSAH